MVEEGRIVWESHRNAPISSKSQPSSANPGPGIGSSGVSAQPLALPAMQCNAPHITIETLNTHSANITIHKFLYARQDYCVCITELWLWTGGVTCDPKVMSYARILVRTGRGILQSYAIALIRFNVILVPALWRSGIPSLCIKLKYDRLQMDR